MTRRDFNYLKDTPGHILTLPGVRWATKRPIPLQVHFATLSDLGRGDGSYNHGHIRTRETPSDSPGVGFQVGAAILTGTKGEVWPIEREKFEATYRAASGTVAGEDGLYFKDGPPVLAVQMKEPFSVSASWGELQGEAGDWLIQYDQEGQSFGIVGQEIADETYEFGDLASDI